jgi:hypothetical protein
MSSMATGLAKAIDFSCKMPSTNMMKGLYVTTIAARLSSARSKDEIREVATRDIPGWLTFFYASSIVQNVIGYTLDKMAKIPEGLTLVKGPKEGKSFMAMLNPFSQYKVRSFDDINAIKNLPEMKPEILKTLTRNKSLAFILGILTSVAVLGICIPSLNVYLTRKSVAKKQAEQKAAQAGGAGNNNTQTPQAPQASQGQYNFSPKVSFNLDPNLKINRFNKMS